MSDSNYYSFKDFLSKLHSTSLTETPLLDVNKELLTSSQNQSQSELSKRFKDLTNNNEALKIENVKMKKDNEKLKKALETIGQKYENEILFLNYSNHQKDKKLAELLSALKDSSKIIEELKLQVDLLSKKFDSNTPENNLSDEQKEQLLEAAKIIDGQKMLLEEIDKRDELIKGLKKELSSKVEIFQEIGKMKDQVDVYAKTMEKLYQDIEFRDKIIEELKKKIDENGKDK